MLAQAGNEEVAELPRPTDLMTLISSAPLSCCCCLVVSQLFRLWKLSEFYITIKRYWNPESLHRSWGHFCLPEPSPLSYCDQKKLQVRARACRPEKLCWVSALPCFCWVVLILTTAATTRRTYCSDWKYVKDLVQGLENGFVHSIFKHDLLDSLTILFMFI